MRQITRSVGNAHATLTIFICRKHLLIWYKFGKITVAVPPQYTSVNCSECGAKVTKTLSTRTHKCKCGCVLDRDENAARNILSIGLRTVGHTGTKAWGDETAILEGASYEVSS